MKNVREHCRESFWATKIILALKFSGLKFFLEKLENPLPSPPSYLMYSHLTGELNVGIDLVCSNELHQDQCFTNKVFIQYKENSELVSISMEVAEKL